MTVLGLAEMTTNLVVDGPRFEARTPFNATRDGLCRRERTFSPIYFVDRWDRRIPS
jgi:hypothetical protein